MLTRHADLTSLVVAYVCLGLLAVAYRATRTKTVEILQLRGARVEDATDRETPESAGFRRRLRAKEE